MSQSCMYVLHITSIFIHCYVSVVSNENAYPARWNCSRVGGQEEEQASSAVYVIDIYPQGDDDENDSEKDIGVSMYFSHTRMYPESFPRVHISSIRGLSDQQIHACCERVMAAMEEHAGVPMIYSLVEVAQEWMNDIEDDAKEALRADDPAVLEEKRRQEEEERIQKLRAHGHEVTPESFRAWKEQFMLEQESKSADRLVKSMTASGKNTVSGKQWFLQQQGDAAAVRQEEYDNEVGEYDDEISRDEIEDDDLVFDSEDSDLEETILGELYEELAT